MGESCACGCYGWTVLRLDMKKRYSTAAEKQKAYRARRKLAEEVKLVEEKMVLRELGEAIEDLSRPARGSGTGAPDMEGSLASGVALTLSARTSAWSRTLAALDTKTSVSIPSTSSESRRASAMLSIWHRGGGPVVVLPVVFKRKRTKKDFSWSHFDR
jgi:hypothetical protein